MTGPLRTELMHLLAKYERVDEEMGRQAADFWANDGVCCPSCGVPGYSEMALAQDRREARMDQIRAKIGRDDGTAPRAKAPQGPPKVVPVAKALDGLSALRYRRQASPDFPVANSKRTVGGGVEYQMLRIVVGDQMYGLAVRCAYQNGRAGAADDLLRARRMLAMAVAHHRQRAITGQAD